MTRPGKIVCASKIEDLPPQKETYQTKILAHLKKNGKTKRSELYYLGDERRIRKEVNKMVLEGLVTERVCECGTTNIIEISDNNGKKK